MTTLGLLLQIVIAVFASYGFWSWGTQLWCNKTIECPKILAIVMFLCVGTSIMSVVEHATTLLKL